MTDSNYIADQEVEPQWVCFDNGRTVGIARPAGREPYLVVGWKQEGEAWLRKMAAAEDAAGCINVDSPSVEPLRGCNRHSDCKAAEDEVMARRKIQRSEISVTFHCHDDECEDCFGC